MTVAEKPLHYFSIHEAQQLIQEKKLSPVELTRAVLDRIGAVDDKLHAYIRLMAEMPETAPANENHILWYDHQVREVKYEEGHVAYRTWGPGRERLKLAKPPREVRGAGERVNSRDALKSNDGWYWDGPRQVLEVRHHDVQIDIVLDGA